MNTPRPKKRPFWQLHLSTGIVLMIVAGLLVWLNCINFARGDGTLSLHIKYGFPLPFWSGHNSADVEMVWIALAFDALLALGAVVIVGAQVERMRRRDS
jgi:hypothetical protein